MSGISKLAVANTKEIAPGHWDSLLGERSDGSLWGRPFVEEDFTQKHWEEVDPSELDPAVVVEGCRYFSLQMAHKHFPDAQLGAVRLGSLGMSELEKVQVCVGPHGQHLGILRVDLLAGGHKELAEGPQEAWCVLGMENGREVIYTAHPGPLMLPCPKEGYPDVEELPGATAVKVGARFKLELVP